MACVSQKTASLNHRIENTFVDISRSSLPRLIPITTSRPAENTPLLQFQKLRQSIIESRKAFLNFSDKPVETLEDPKIENVSTESKKYPAKKISFKVKRPSAIYRKSAPYPKLSTISANKVAELTQKFNQMVSEKSAILEEPKFRKLVKRVNSQKSSDSERGNIARNSSIKIKENRVKVTRKPSLKTKPIRLGDNVVILKSTVQRKQSFKSSDRSDGKSDISDKTIYSDEKFCVRAKIGYLESPHPVEKAEIQQSPVRPKTLSYRQVTKMDTETVNLVESPNTGTVKATIEIFERRTSESNIPLMSPTGSVKSEKLKPKVPEKNFTTKTREIIAKNCKYKTKVLNETGYGRIENNSKSTSGIIKKTFNVKEDKKYVNLASKSKEGKVDSNHNSQETSKCNSLDSQSEDGANKIHCNEEKELEKIIEAINDTLMEIGAIKNIEEKENLQEIKQGKNDTFEETKLNKNRETFLEKEITKRNKTNIENNNNNKTDINEEKVQIVNIPSTLPQLKCDSKYETSHVKKNSPLKQVLKLDLLSYETKQYSKNPEHSLNTSEIKPNTSFLWSRNQDKSPSAPYKSLIFIQPNEFEQESPKSETIKSEDDLDTLYDFVDPKINEDVPKNASENIYQSPTKPPVPIKAGGAPPPPLPALPPKMLKKKLPLPEDKIYEELDNKDLDNGYEYCQSPCKYEDVESKSIDDGYEYCASPKEEENIYETLPLRQESGLSRPRRQQQEPLPPRPPSRGSYCTIQNSEIDSNCYESIYNPESSLKKEIDVESNYESIYGCHIREIRSNRDSLVSSDQQSNSLYGRYFNGFGESHYNGKATSDLSSSDKSDEWVDMSDGEEKADGGSNIVIVLERQKNKKSSQWSRHCREQWAKSPKKLPTDLGCDSDSDHHYETLGAGADDTLHDDDYDSFDTDSDSDSSSVKVNLADCNMDIGNHQLPEPPNNQAYGLTKLAATAGKHMRKLRRNWSLTKNDISRSLSRMTKRKSRSDLEAAGIVRIKTPKNDRTSASPPNTKTSPVESSNLRLSISPEPTAAHTNIPYQNVEFSSVQNVNNQAESPIERPKSITGFLSKFRRSMSISAESASEITSNLENKPKSTFYLTETIDIDSGVEKKVDDEQSPDSGISETPPIRRSHRSALIRPQSPPPPAPTQVPDSKKTNKKDKRTTSWYAEAGVFKNMKTPVQYQPKKPNTFWYAEVGLYQTQSGTQASTPSTSSAENSGNTTNADIKPSDFINQDNNEEYYNLKNESEYYNCSVKSFSSTETKKDQSLTNLNTPDIQLRLQDEPLYQFYDAAVLESVCKDGTSDFDSDGYEEVGDTRNSELRSSLRPSAMDIVCPKRNSIAFTRTLWCEIPEVIQSSVLSTLNPQQKKIQEAKFEMVTSEASYLNSLNVLNDHFISNLKSCDNLTKEEFDILFGQVHAVKACSEKLLLDMEKCWQDNILLNGVCDVVQKHAEENFSVYVTYCENQIFFDDTLKNIKERQSLYEHLRKLETSSACQSLTLYSFLLLPMQRITRWPLLVDAILKRLTPEDPEYITCQYALATLNKIVSQCNEAARRKEREIELKKIASQLEFGKYVQSIEIIAPKRWLIRSGPVTQMMPRNDETLLTFGKKFTKVPLYLFLFNDLLLVTKPKSENCYSVIHYCPKNLVELNTADMLPSLPVKDSQSKNLLFLTILENQDDKMVELLISLSNETDKERWVEAILPPKSEDPNETLYECWDCPQVTAVHSYNANQPDELALSRGDVINVLRKMADGWYHGERIRDGQTGWFPANYTAEIASPHVRARNLKQRYRLLALSENYLKSK